MPPCSGLTILQRVTSILSVSRIFYPEHEGNTFFRNTIKHPSGWTTSILALEPTQPLAWWVLAAPFRGMKRPELEAQHLPPSVDVGMYLTAPLHCTVSNGRMTGELGKTWKCASSSLRYCYSICHEKLTKTTKVCV